MKKYLVLVLSVLVGLAFGATKIQASSPNVVINEFLSDGTEWVELFNPASSDIDLTGWYIQDRTGTDLSGVNTTATLSGSITAQGFLLVNISGTKLNNDKDIITLFDNGNNQIDQIPYGSALGAVVAAPASGKSAYRTVDGGSMWAISVSPTPGSTNSPVSISPTLTLTNPVGGEAYKGGDLVTISWASTNPEEFNSANPVSVGFNPDPVANPSNWTGLASSQPASGSYEWAVPNIDTVNAQIMLMASDKAAQHYYPTSGAFSISQVIPSANLVLTTPSTLTITKSTLLSSTNGVADDNAAVTSAVATLSPIDVTLSNTGNAASANVRISPVGAGAHIQLWAKDSANNWYDINVTGWGPSTGFSLPAGETNTTPVYVISDLAGSYPLTINVVDAATPSTVITTAGGTITVNDPSVPKEPQLVAQDFGVVNYDTGLGIIKGYTAGFGLTDTTFAGAKSVVVKLYRGDTLLQTNMAVLSNFNRDITGTQFSSPFEVFGSFNYSADGYWTNGREAEYGQTLIPNKVVATVTLANNKIVTATNENLTGDPAVVLDPPTDKDQCKNGQWQSFGNQTFPNQGQCVSSVVSNAGGNGGGGGGSSSSSRRHNVISLFNNHGGEVLGASIDLSGSDRNLFIRQQLLQIMMQLLNILQNYQNSLH